MDGIEFAKLTVNVKNIADILLETRKAINSTKEELRATPLYKKLITLQDKADELESELRSARRSLDAFFDDYERDGND